MQLLARPSCRLARLRWRLLAWDPVMLRIWTLLRVRGKIVSSLFFSNLKTRLVGLTKQLNTLFTPKTSRSSTLRDRAKKRCRNSATNNG